MSVCLGGGSVARIVQERCLGTPLPTHMPRQTSRVLHQPQLGHAGGPVGRDHKMIQHPHIHQGQCSLQGLGQRFA